MTFVAFAAPELHEPIFDAVCDALRVRMPYLNEVDLADLTLSVIQSIRDAGYIIGKEQ